MERDDTSQSSGLGSSFAEPLWWRRLLLQTVRSYLFYSVAAYILLALVFGAAIYAIQKDTATASYRFIDTLFSAASALTVTGTCNAMDVAADPLTQDSSPSTPRPSVSARKS